MSWASLTEVGAGALLLAGLLTPLAAAGVIGVMVVALITIWITRWLGPHLVPQPHALGPWQILLEICLATFADYYSRERSCQVNLDAFDVFEFSEAFFQAVNAERAGKTGNVDRHNLLIGSQSGDRHPDQ